MNAEYAPCEGMRFTFIGILEDCGVKSALACRDLKQLLVIELYAKALGYFLGYLLAAAAKLAAN